MTQENDLVLIYFEEKPMMFARIEDISADSKPGWYHVRLLMLQIPLQVVTWILRESYIDGEEFTMGGHKMRLEKVVCPEEPDITGLEKEATEEETKPSPTPEASAGAKVISFRDRMKK